MKNQIVIKIGEKKLNIHLLSILTFLFFCRSPFIRFAQTFHISTALVGGAIMILFLTILGLYSVKSSKNICWDGVFLILFFVLFFWRTIVVHPEYQERYDNLANSGLYSAKAVFAFGAGIYAYYIIRLYKNDFKKLYADFYIVPYFIMILNIWTIFFDRSQEYKMGFGYQMSLAAIFFIGQYLFEEKKKIRLILSLICIGMGVLYGSRACIVGYVVFVAIFLLWQHKLNIRQGVVIGLGAIALILYSSQTAMLFIYNFFSSLGIQSRTLYRIIIGDLTADTARQEKIWPVLINALENSSLFEIRGAYGGRYLLRSIYVYEHNIILEILITFGKFFGGIILVWIVIKFIKVLFFDKEERGFMALAFGAFAISRLMFSSSFWYEPYFWAFIAVLVSRVKCSSVRKKTDD